MDEALREQHRGDLLQILAYSTVKPNKKITCCLVYPCTVGTWESLKRRGRLSHRATLFAGQRKIGLLLTAVPMTARVSEVVVEMRRILADAT